MTFTVSLSEASQQVVALNYEVLGEVTDSGTISIAVGETSAALQFGTDDDNVPEGDSSVELRITGSMECPSAR